MIKIRGVFKEFSVISSSAIAGQTLSLVISFFIAKQLGAVKFGEYSYLLALTTMGPIIYGLGIPNAIYRFYNTTNSIEYRIKVVGSGLLTVLSSSLIISIALFFILGFIDLGILQEYKLSIISLTFFLSINNLFNVVLRASRDYKVTSFLSISQPVIKSILILILFLSNSLKISSLILVAISIEFISFLTVLYFIKKEISFKKISLNTIVRMFKYGSPFVPHKFLTKGQDPLIKSFVLSLIGPEAVGVYALGQKIALPFGFILDKFQFIWGPLKFSIKNEINNSKEIFSNLITVYVIITSIASCIYMFTISGIIGFDLIPKYPGVLPITFLFILVATLRGNYYMYGTGAEFGDSMKILPFVSGGYVGILILAKLLYSDFDLKLSYIFLPIILSELYSILMIRIYSKRVFTFEISLWTQAITLTLATSGVIYIFTSNMWVLVISGMFYTLYGVTNLTSVRKAIGFLNNNKIG